MFSLKPIFFLCIIIQLSLAQVGPILQIKNGRIMGRTGQTAIENKPYYAFQGIPYAEPPVHNLRFVPPVAKENWDGIIGTTADRKMCVQLSSQILGMTVEEDCLYINVYSPNLNATNLPVMVFIYGGGFILGSSSYDEYGPDYLLEQNVIFVSFNYRVGIFGFYSTEDQVAPGNAGLKDQVLALKWVQENIAFFGGNPEDVTLFGQSAGAAGVSYLMQTPITKGLFQRTILQSGSSLNLWALSRNKRESVFATGQFLGINTTDSSILLQEMQKKDAHELLYGSLVTEVVLMGLNNPLDGLLFSPTIEPENELAIITSKSYAEIENGNFHHVPSIIGYNTNEFLAFFSAIALIRMYLVSYNIDVSRFSPIDMNVSNQTLKQHTGNLISNQYDVNTIIFTLDQSIEKLITDDQFIRPLNKIAHLQSKFAPVYLYRYSYLSNISNHYEYSGVAHGDELDMMFICHDQLIQTDRDLLTKNRFIKLWTNFAKTSNPTPSKDTVLQNVIWEPVTIDKQNYLDIGDDLVLGTDPDKERVQFWEELYSKYGNPPYDTY